MFLMKFLSLGIQNVEDSSKNCLLSVNSSDPYASFRPDQAYQSGLQLYLKRDSGTILKINEILKYLELITTDKANEAYED